MSLRDGRHWSEVALDELVAVELSDDGRLLLWDGLHQWGGPTRPSDAVAQVIGFCDVATLHAEGRRIRAALKSGDPLSKRDWQRALVAIEIVWSSSYYGAAGDWEIVSGRDDHQTLRVLRSVQRKLIGLRHPPRERVE